MSSLTLISDEVCSDAGFKWEFFCDKGLCGQVPFIVLIKSNKCRRYNPD